MNGIKGDVALLVCLVAIKSEGKRREKQGTFALSQALELVGKTLLKTKGRPRQLRGHLTLLCFDKPSRTDEPEGS